MAGIVRLCVDLTTTACTQPNDICMDAMRVGVVRSHSASHGTLGQTKLLASSLSWRSEAFAGQRIAFKKRHALPARPGLVAKCCASALLTNC